MILGILKKLNDCELGITEMRENNIIYRKRVGKIKKDFSKRAVMYDDYIVKVVPYHEEMLEALISNISFAAKEPFKIIELGCGTGIATYSIKKRYPNAHLTCIDMSSEMLDRAKEKLKVFPNIEYELADFTKYRFKEKYDVVLSFLSLMYLSGSESRKSIFKKAYNALKPGGIFIAGEVNISSNKYFQGIQMKKWIEHMQKSYSNDFIKEEVLEKAKKHGRLSVLLNEIQWLKNIGFSHTEVFWKYYNFSVYGAIK